MKLRQLAVAFLLNEEQEVLLLQKKNTETFLAGFLVPIGGHIEEFEINEPRKACVREVEEETGIKEEFIDNLRLRYVVLRLKDNEEIRVQYVFFGNVSKTTPLIESEEGSLVWADNKEIANNKNVSATTNEVIHHYIDIGKLNEEVYVGSMNSLNGNPVITWGLLKDWEIPLLR